MPEDQTTSNQTPDPLSSAPNNDVPRVDPVPVAPTVAEAPVSMPAIEQEPASMPAAAPLVNDPASQSNPTFGSGSDQPTQPEKKSNKKKWIIGGVIAAVIVILGGGGAWAYTAYQSPDKVIMDGMVNALTNKSDSSASATFSIKNDSVQADITVDGQSHDSTGKGKVSLNLQIKDSTTPLKVSTSAEIVATQSTLYFKLDNIKQTVDSALDTYVSSLAKQYESYGYTLTQSDISSMKESIGGQIDPILAKVDNRWMKADLTSKDTDSEEQTCTVNAVKKLQSDSKMQNQLENVYEKNRFITVKENLGVKNGSYGYVLDLDQTKAKAFGKAAEDTDFGKALKACDKSSIADSEDVDSSSDDSLKNSRVELWISQWAHKVTELKVSGKDSDSTSYDLDLTMKYDGVGKIAVPSNATDIKDVQKEIEGIFGGSSASSDLVI